MSEWHSYVEDYFVPSQLALAMFGMGATLRVRDFTEVFRRPVGVAIGLFLQLVVVPLVAFAITRLFNLSAGWAVGLILVSVVPGGAFSNLMTYFGRGNVPLSIAMTVTATAACVITLPLLLSIFASAHLPADFALPTGQIVLEIGLYLIIPLAIGMVVFASLPGQAQSISQWAIRISMLLIVVVTLSALGSGRIKVGEYGWQPPAVIVLFGATLAVVIPNLCRLFGRYDDDSVAIGIEVTVRNIGVALLLIHFFFPDTPQQGHVLYTCLFYAGLSGWVAVPLLLNHRVGRTAVPFRRRNPRPARAEAVPHGPQIGHESH